MPSNKDFLLEIGVEEIPARFLNGLMSGLEKKTAELLNEYRLDHTTVKSLGTMRRLVISVKGLSEKQSDVVKEVRGPSKSVAVNEDGSFTKAAAGFATSQNVTVKELTIKEAGGKEFVFAVNKAKGIATSKILKEFIPKLITSLYLPITMKWGDGNFSFIRPIRYILSIFGEETVKCSVDDVVSSNKTMANRSLFGKKSVEYKATADLEDFQAFLLKNGVVLDFKKRKDEILGQIKTFENDTREKVLCDAGLVEETANLVENPKVLRAKFGQQFMLVLPQDAISTVVKKQQKCFPVMGSGSFLIVADSASQKEVISGYEQVVNARLADAKFFYDEDIKHNLEDNIEKMKKIVYHEKIGSMWDKMARIEKISKMIAEKLLDHKQLAPLVERIAHLSKADLTTHMVGEFPSLAGIMGKEYSLVSGEDVRVAKGIFEHYLPRFSGDQMPSEIEGAIVGLADRIDSITGCFCNGIIPTGSQDPYALRRAAQGIVSIILAKNMSFHLSLLVSETMKIYGSGDNDAEQKITEFIKQRLKVLLEEEGVRYDIADAVLSNGDVLPLVYCKAFEIVKVANEPWFKSVVTSADRITRICKGEEAISNISTELLVDNEEKEVYRIFLQVKDIFTEKLSCLDLSAALKTLEQLSEPLDIFFEKVLVMHNDEKLKKNRLALLKNIEALFLMFADFKKIVI